MTALTQLQRDAMAQAAAGQWDLADAIELLARAENDRGPEGEPLLHGVRIGNRLQWLVFGGCVDCDGTGQIDCGECDGSGEVACSACGHEAECEACDDGQVECTTCDDVLATETGGGCEAIVDLNGQMIWQRNPDDPDNTPPDCTATLSRGWARDVVAAWQKTQDEQLAAAAAEVPMPRGATQSTLIPETT